MPTKSYGFCWLNEHVQGLIVFRTSSHRRSLQRIHERGPHWNEDGFILTFWRIYLILEWTRKVKEAPSA